MRHLGVLRGNGVLESNGHAMGEASYEFDGYLVKQGEIVGSGEIEMDAAILNDAFGRNDLTLRTEDGRVLSLRFSGKLPAPGKRVAHADVRNGLPSEKEWRRSRGSR